MIIERYIGTNLVKGWLLVLLVLGAVFGLIGFIQELERTRFDYNALAVARYTLFILPQQLVSLAPVIALLGSIVALANLDRYNELTIVSCSGFSLAKLLGALALPTLLLMSTAAGIDFTFTLFGSAMVNVLISFDVVSSTTGNFLLAAFCFLNSFSWMGKIGSFTIQ